jgi:SAM-dependent methyltransferase
MNPINWLLGQSRRPKGWAGRFLARGMNRSHAAMTDWILSQVSVRDCESLLDVGCGGGGALLKLSSLTSRAELHGIDYSKDSLGVAERTNRQLLDQGRLFLREANVSSLPFEDGRFDLALAINSHYFWPDLDRCLREIQRVLRAHGSIVVAGGEYFGGKYDSRIRRLASNGRMNCQTLSELQEILCEAEYVDVIVHEEWNRGWFCVMACKPLGSMEKSMAPN